MDISTDGLRRLARMVNDQRGIDPQLYEQAVDPDLQRLFQVPSSPEPTSLRFDFWPIRPAHADTAVDRLNHWVPKKSELDEYLPLAHRLLKKTAATTVRFQADNRYEEICRQQKQKCSCRTGERGHNERG